MATTLAAQTLYGSALLALEPDITRHCLKTP